jgi:hypothetical protein
LARSPWARAHGYVIPPLRGSETSQMPKREEWKRLALIMAVNCVRNTVIEDYHAKGKITDGEMKKLNKEVSNKIYTFLHYLFHESEDDRQAFLQAMSMMYPTNWDEPKLDAEFTQAVKSWKKHGNSLRQFLG